ncbi:DUF4783 domain-containing protein [Salinibacter grassmerensis]|uniref:DUF4783 domain-containing protein n=1 Tax=Salinibacter grassmerensis TaxID=3040353 RepID=UPI0021E93EDF|nr:DUF4783 domain-containing protein [Salinibacter grassmerensis]
MSVPKSLMVLLVVGIGGAPSVVQGQAADSIASVPDSTTEDTPAVARRVATAFAEGDARRLLTPSADRVEISLFGNRTFYSDSQAVYVLREFFRRHPSGRFAMGDVMAAGTSFFVRGEYEEARMARRHHVYVRLDQPQGEDLWNLHEVRIEHAE